MRFKRVDIPAFGPFTGLEIDLPSGGGDLHLFHGPNEAGKSSFLRALRALLFGIPGKSADNFIHDYKTLRIAAELERADGVSRIVQRRKGNKNTLLDANGEALAAEALGEFLGEVDEAYFDSMFGLGSEELRIGADELLRGEGRLGQALFSASLGGTPVERVIQGLQAEAAGHFSGRARKGVSIREAVKELAEHRKRARESVVNPREWEELVGQIEALEERRRGLLEAKGEKSNRNAWLERCRDALSSVGQLAEARANLERLPDLPELAEQFGGEIREARKAWQDAVVGVQGLVGRLDKLRAQAAECPLAPGVLAEEAAIDALHAGLGVWQDNQAKLGARSGRAAQLETKVGKACCDLGIEASLDQLDGLRVSEPEHLQVRETAGALQEAEEELATTLRKIESRRGEIAKLGAGRPVASDAGQVEALEAAVREAGLIEAMSTGLEDRRSMVEGLQRSMERRHQQLAGVPDDQESAGKLQVPSKAGIEKFRVERDDLQRELRTLEADRAARVVELGVLDEDLKRLGRQRELPSLDALQAAREHRDRGWQLVLEDWKGEGASGELVEGRALEESYPEAVSSADGLADRLRVEAEAVAQMEEKRAQRALAATTLEDCGARQKELQAALDEWAADWKEAWRASGVEPRSPEEMAEWREAWVDFGRLWDEWDLGCREIARHEEAIASAEGSLASALGGGNAGGFSNLLAEAREKLKALGQAAGAMQALEKQIGDKDLELAGFELAVPALEAARNTAAGEWETCRDGWSLPLELSPRNALELLRARRDMFADYDRWEELRRELADLETAIREFESRAARLAAQLGLGQGDPEKNEAACWQALQAARREQARFEGLAEQIASDEEGLDEAKRIRDASRRDFDTLFARTALAEESGLDEFLEHFDAQAGWRKRIRDLRDSIAGLSRGEPVDEFIARVDGEDADAIDGSLTTLQEEISARDDELEQVKADLLALESRRREMESADDEAARHSQFAESAAARIRHDADRFVRLRLAISLLEGQIDRFREQNQGPFMEKAGQWFATLTGGAFTGITTSYDAGDDPVIAGLRAGDTGHREVLVDGMSEGTRDQLYLALRLAGLEMHLAEHEPMPMILDDLLVHFDDTRARHALAALGQLAGQSQVLLFTHHAHLVELARQELGEKGFHLHEL